MSDEFTRIKEEPGLSDLILPVRAQHDRAYQDLREAKAAFELARKTLERAEAAFDLEVLKLDQVMRFAMRLGYSREELDHFCDRELATVQKQQVTEIAKKRTYGNTELMIKVAELLANAGEPLTLAEIMGHLDQMGIHLPGKAPERNLTAYLSRSPLITSVRRGWYYYDEQLLKATRRRMEGENGDDKRE